MPSLRKCILNFKDYFDNINNLYGYCHFYADIRETVGDRNKREDFDQSVSRKHFLTKQDIRNIKAKVDDRIVKRHEDDASSVSMMVDY